MARTPRWIWRTFAEVEGTFEVGEDLASSRASGTIKAASLSTNEQAGDEQLRSADFFDVENHPDIAFATTSIEATGDAKFTITGDLTMHGVTKPITLHGEAGGTEQGPRGNERVGLEAQDELNRSDYEMKFNQALGSGNLMVADKVKINLDVSASWRRSVSGVSSPNQRRAFKRSLGIVRDGECAPHPDADATPAPRRRAGERASGRASE